jgi:translation initiation factor IF-2
LLSGQFRAGRELDRYGSTRAGAGEGTAAPIARGSHGGGRIRLPEGGVLGGRGREPPQGGRRGRPGEGSRGVAEALHLPRARARQEREARLPVRPAAGVAGPVPPRQPGPAADDGGAQAARAASPAPAHGRAGAGPRGRAGGGGGRPGGRVHGPRRPVAPRPGRVPADDGPGRVLPAGGDAHGGGPRAARLRRQRPHLQPPRRALHVPLRPPRHAHDGEPAAAARAPAARRRRRRPRRSGKRHHRLIHYLLCTYD